MSRIVTSAEWQVTLCDPMWHVSSRSGAATLQTAINLLLTYLLLCPRAYLRDRSPSFAFLCMLPIFIFLFKHRRQRAEAAYMPVKSLQ